MRQYLLFLATIFCMLLAFMSTPGLCGDDAKASKDEHQFATYHIGNSLSQDLYKGLRVLIDQEEKKRGYSYSYGFIFRGATCLPYFYNHANDADVKSFVGLTATSRKAMKKVAWPEALSEYRWDIITMQPVGAKGQGSNLLADNVKVINAFIAQARKNPANAKTRFLIYATWDGVSLKDPNRYSKFYPSKTIIESNPDSTPCSPARDLTLLLCDRVRKTNPNVDLIPVGEVHYALDTLMKKGKFEGFTDLTQIHRDRIHANSTGQNIAAWTAYAVIYRKSPEGMPNIPYGNGLAKGYTNVKDMSDHDRLLIQKTIWQTVKELNAYTQVVPTRPQTSSVGKKSAGE